jgi:hypothetical protein
MESFFKRLEKYIQIRPTAAMVDIIVKIILEVISILRIVTKEIGQGKTSMPCLIISFMYLRKLMFTQRSFSRSCQEGMMWRTPSGG